MNLLQVLPWAAAALSSVAYADDVVATVMSFNVRTSYANDHGTCGPWSGERKDNVISQVRAVSPDFFGTQETSEEQRAFMDAQLSDTYGSIGKDSGSLNGAASEVDAVYYKTAEWSKLDEGTLWLGPDIHVPSVAWGMVYYRTCVYGRFKHIKSGDTVCMFNTHYETPGNDEAQIQASNIIMKEATAVCQPGDKLTVLTGDFNARPNYPAIQKLFAGGWTDKSRDPTFCGNMVQSTCQEKFDFTLQLNAGVEGQACWQETNVVREAFGSNCYPSDHAVLVSKYCLSGSCCGGLSSSGSMDSNDSSSGSKDGTSSSDSGPKKSILRASGALDVGGEAKNPSTTNKKDSSGINAANTQASDSGSGGTVGAVVGVIGALAAVAAVVAVVVIRRRRSEVDRELSSKKDDSPGPSLSNREMSDVEYTQQQTGRPTPDANAPAGKLSSLVGPNESGSYDHVDGYDRMSTDAMMELGSSNASSAVIMELDSNRGSSTPQMLTNTRSAEALSEARSSDLSWL